MNATMTQAINQYGQTETRLGNYVVRTGGNDGVWVSVFYCKGDVAIDSRTHGTKAGALRWAAKRIATHVGQKAA